MYEYYLLISDEFPRSLSNLNPLIPIWFGGTLFFIIYWALGKLNKKLNINSESNRLINKRFLIIYWSLWGFFLYAFTTI
jgi:hypothetical protein